MKTMLMAVLVCVAAICGACGEPWAVEPSCMDHYDQVAVDAVKDMLECAGPGYEDYIRENVDTVLMVRGCPCGWKTSAGLCEAVGCAYVKDGCRVIEVRQPMQLPIGTADTMVHEAAHQTPTCSSLPHDANEACAEAVDEDFWKQALHCQYPVPR